MKVYFAVCPQCRNHGHFAFSDGHCSQEVLSQGEAINMSKALFVNMMSEKSFEMLFEQISQSGLPLITTFDMEFFFDIEGKAEDLLRTHPIVYPDSWSDARRPPIDDDEERCSFFQEVLSRSRPALQ